MPFEHEHWRDNSGLQARVRPPIGCVVKKRPRKDAFAFLDLPSLCSMASLSLMPSPLTSTSTQTHRGREAPPHAMVQHPLGEVRIAGSLLAALMKQVGSQAGTHAEGLLLGAAHKLAVAVTDDNQEATEDTMMQLDLTGYECTGSRDTFYDPVTAAVDKGQLAAATAGVNGGNKRGEHVSVLGLGDQ